jgi:hypothetical protein
MFDDYVLAGYHSCPLQPHTHTIPRMNTALCAAHMRGMNMDVVFPQARTYTFVAISKLDRDAWMACLHIFCSRQILSQAYKGKYEGCVVPSLMHRHAFDVYVYVCLCFLV